VLAVTKSRIASRQLASKLWRIFKAQWLSTGRLAASGNSTPSLIHYRSWFAKNSGMAAIPSQRSQADAILVRSGHRRHPASGLNWGRRLQKRVAPFFKVLIAQSAET
jgi:hypothetical protein